MHDLALNLAGLGRNLSPSMPDELKSADRVRVLSPQRKEARDKLRQLISKKIEGSESGIFNRSKDLGVFHFDDLKEDYDAIREFYDKVKQVEWAVTPLASVNGLAEETSRLVSNLDRLREFRIDQHPHNLRDAHASFKAAVVDKWHDIYRGWGWFLLFELELLRDSATIQQQVEQFKNELKGPYDEMRPKVEALTGEVIDALDKVRRAAELAGITKEAAHFRRAARWAVGTAAFWFVFSGAVGITVYRLGKPMLLTYGPHPTVEAWLYWGLPRVFLLSLLFTALIFALRQFSAACHNVVTNRHRQNALSTFQTFVAAASGDPEIKHAILLQATQAIFSPAQSGYLKGEIEVPQINRLTETIIKEGGKPHA